ncbi:MAG: glycosyltransferase [Candidatus Cyclobacteriaceae bacterium M3_2C_046]
MPQPEISIILPVKNAENTIHQAVKSILNQTFEDLELIVIDDHCQDHTLEKLAKISDSRIKVLQPEGKGLVDGLNQGIRYSKGRYLARMDADDISLAWRLEKQLDLLKQEPEVDVVSGLVEYVGDQKNHQGYYLHVQWLNQLITCRDIYLNRFVDAPLAHPSAMFRRSLIGSGPFYREGSFPEDYDLWLRLFEQGVRFKKITWPVLQWRDHPARLSRTSEKYKRLNFTLLKLSYFNQWFKSKSDQNRAILIWGIGAKAKYCGNFLKERGVTVAGYIDVTPKKYFNNHPVIHYHDIKLYRSCFILSFVSDRTGRKLVHQYLLDQGWIEGKDFYRMA